MTTSIERLAERQQRVLGTHTRALNTLLRRLQVANQANKFDDIREMELTMNRIVDRHVREIDCFLSVVRKFSRSKKLSEEHRRELLPLIEVIKQSRTHTLSMKRRIN